MTKIHDLIIGDLGRKGTLRYFQSFSAAEQNFLQEQLETEEFFDEYRMVRYTIVGALRDIKREFLPDNLSEIEDSVLVGVDGGPSPVDILPEVVAIAVPYALKAAQLGATVIRLLIPCNTMYSVAVRLRDIFLSPLNFQQFVTSHGLQNKDTEELHAYMREISIEVPTVAEEVLEHLDEQGMQIVKVAASSSACKAYEKVIDKKYDDMEFEAWLPEGVDTFSDLLQMAIQNEHIDTGGEKSNGREAVVSACTDIHIHNTIDSTHVFARRLVESAYDRLHVN